MKAQVFYLTSLDVLSSAVAFITKIIPDGSIKVTVSDAGSKSAKQRGLQWMWMDDISKAGIGGELGETKEGSHLACKYRFAIPIFIRDDEFFCDLYTAFVKRHEGDQERIRWFVDQYVSTEKFNVSQMAEYLTAIQHYYVNRGVNLTDPQFRGLLD